MNNYCRNCGKEINQDKFCTSCGVEVIEERINVEEEKKQKKQSKVYLYIICTLFAISSISLYIPNMNTISSISSVILIISIVTAKIKFPENKIFKIIFIVATCFVIYYIITILLFTFFCGVMAGVF